jgi:hypothetical protein
MLPAHPPPARAMLHPYATEVDEYPQVTCSIRASLAAEVAEACRACDDARKGYLSKRELKYVFVSCMGIKPSKVRHAIPGYSSS